MQFDTQVDILLSNHDTVLLSAPHYCLAVCSRAGPIRASRERAAGADLEPRLEKIKRRRRRKKRKTHHTAHGPCASSALTLAMRSAPPRSRGPLVCRSLGSMGARLGVSGAPPHPVKRSPSSTAASQTSLNFHLLWNVVRRGTWLFLEAFSIFLWRWAALPGQFELFRQARLKALAWRLIEVSAQAAVRWPQRKIYCCGPPKCEKINIICINRAQCLQLLNCFTVCNSPDLCLKPADPACPASV